MDHVDSFIASLKRCLARPEFMLDFYGRFMASSDEIREKFAETDFDRQTRVLADSLWVMAVAAQAPKESPAWGDLPAPQTSRSINACWRIRSTCQACWDIRPCSSSSMA